MSVVFPVHFWQLLWSWVVALKESHRMWQWWVSNHGQSHSQSPWDKLGMRHQHYGEPEWTDNFSTTERFLLLWCYWKIGSKFKSKHPNGLVVWKGGVNWKEFPRVHTVLHTYVWVRLILQHSYIHVDSIYSTMATICFINEHFSHSNMTIWVKTTYLRRRQGQFRSRPADTLQAIQNEYAHKSQSAPHRVPGQFATQND